MDKNQLMKNIFSGIFADKPGLLVKLELNEEESYRFFTYLSNLYSTNIWDIMGNMFDEQLFLFLDMFSGQTIKVPSRVEVQKIVSYMKIYQYLYTKGFTDDSYNQAAKVFGKRVNALKRIVAKVDKVVYGKETKEDGTEET